MAQFGPSYFPGVQNSFACTIDMNDAAHAIILSGTSSSTETVLTSNVLIVDPDSGGASEDLTLPAVASCTGLVLFIFNSGGEGIVVKAVGGSTIITLDTAQSGLVASDGTTWRGFIGGVT